MADSEKDDLVAVAKEQFQQCLDASIDNRRSALDDIKFAREGLQWPDDIRRQRELEGRPCLTINKLPAFIRQVVNDQRQNKPAIHVHPVDSGADKETAKIISGLIRNIEYTSNADIAYDTAVECAVTGGFGYLRIGVDYACDDVFDMDITVNRVSNPFSVYEDPASRSATSDDWNLAFVTDRLTKKQFERDYPKAQKVDWDDEAWSKLRGEESGWLTDEGVLVAEWWTREKVDKKIVLLEGASGPFVTSKEQIESDEDLQIALAGGALRFLQERTAQGYEVKQRIMTGLEVLEENEWLGRYIPIVPVYGEEFDIEGKRYFRGLVHNAVDAQRMFNYWRTTSTELVALAPRVPYIGPKGAFDSDQERWQTANVRSHPYLEYDVKVDGPAGAPQRQNLDSGPAAGALQESLNASDDIKAILGMFDASLGQKSNETSGRAILARQREGDVSSFHFIDNMARAIRHTGRILIDLIPKVYNTPRIVRVIGEDGRETAQEINRQTPQLDKKGQPVRDEFGNAVMAMHDLTSGKYDLTVTTGPSFTTRREEAAAQMTEMVRAMPQALPILGKHLARNLDWPGADDIAEELEKMSEGQIPEPVQKAIEEGKQLINKLQQENQNLKMDTSVDQAKTQASIQSDQVKLSVEQQKAEAMIALEREKVAAQLEMQRQKIANDREIAMMKLRADQDARAMEHDGAEVEGEGGEKVVKSGTQLVMEGLVQLGQLIAQQGEATNRQMARLAEIMSAPNELVRDPKTGRAVGSRKAMETLQ